MGEKKMLTAKEFALATGISYPVVIKWLRDGTIPAEQEEFRIWRIPTTMVERFKRPENRPRKGRPKKAAKKGGAK
jgi:predicted site-specific integrase-resolvase